MDIGELVTADRIVTGYRPADKPKLLAELAHRAAAALQLDEQTLLNLLKAREELGSTGVGHGVAIPHARIDGLSRFFGLFLRLDRPIEFASIDGQPVDLVCVSAPNRDPALKE